MAGGGSRPPPDVALNALTAARPSEFTAAVARPSRRPTANEVELNRRHWEIPTPGVAEVK
jgi:hypothetical protein